MIILDISNVKSDSPQQHMPMAWLQSTDPLVKERIETFREEGKRKNNPHRVRFLEEDADRESVVSHSSSYCSECPQSPILTDEEREKIWYTKKEIQAMRTESKDFVRDQKLKVDSDSFSIRGLEDAVSMRASVERKARKAAVLHCVLNEQRRQLNQGAIDLEKLRRKCKLASKESLKLALQLAEQDRDAAQEDTARPTWVRTPSQSMLKGQTEELLAPQPLTPPVSPQKSAALSSPLRNRNLPSIPTNSKINNVCTNTRPIRRKSNTKNIVLDESPSIRTTPVLVRAKLARRRSAEDKQPTMDPLIANLPNSPPVVKNRPTRRKSDAKHLASNFIKTPKSPFNRKRSKSLMGAVPSSLRGIEMPALDPRNDHERSTSRLPVDSSRPLMP